MHSLRPRRPQAGVFAGDHSSDGEFNVRLDGEQGEANPTPEKNVLNVRAGCTLKKAASQRTLKDVLDVRAHDRRPKLPPPVAQSGRAGAGVEREAEARQVA